MAALTQHRILIASLFLPNTVAIYSDDSPSHGTPTQQLSTSPSAPQTGGAKPPGAPSTPAQRVSSPGPGGTGAPRLPLRSIVEDLASKTGSPAPTPAVESSNPFSGFVNLASTLSALPTSKSSPTPIPSSGGAPPSPRSPSDSNELTSRRLSRTGSRSSSSKRSSGFTVQASDFSRISPWSVELSPHLNGGLHNAINSVNDRLRRKLWIGIIDMQTNSVPTKLKTDIEKKLKDECDSIPVWTTDEEFHGCYDVFCHQVLWPSLHYAVPDAPKTKVFYESTSFEQYRAVNQKFADAIVEQYQEGDIVWVNDYHLCLVPQMVREKIPKAAIGFFLHVAFPSSEIFRCLAVREPLLRGLLGSDLIGFQTHNYARHFRQTVSRILAYEALPKGIQLESSFVDVAVFPIGIDVVSLTQKRREPEVTEWVNLLKQRYNGMKMIVGRDKLDEVQGVRQKIVAFERFLEKNPEYVGKVVLIQVALSTSSTNELQASISDVVSRINSRFSTLTYQPVVFLHTQDLTFSQYLALLTVADAFIVTSLREGMALRTHEFVECQEERARPLILSEFTGSYSYSGFRSCIAINPWDAKTTAEAILQALTMSDEEARSRWTDLHKHVITQTAQAFVTTFLSRCLRVHREHLQRDPHSIPLLSPHQILPLYHFAPKRLILIDLEGTLLQQDPKSVREKGFVPPDDVVELLKDLAKDERNHVWVLSGLPVKGGLEKLALTIPEIGLCAENGCFIKPRAVNGKPQDWLNMVSSFNPAWKPLCLDMLAYYTERTPASYIDDRGASVVWRFLPGNVAAMDEHAIQWARRQAAEAQNHIWDSLGERFGLRIVPGATSFLVLPKNISRSSAVGYILQPHNPTSTSDPPMLFSPDASSPSNSLSFSFILALSADERLLRRLNDLDTDAETVTTGMKSSDAKWRVDPKDVMGLLKEFVKAP